MLDASKRSHVTLMGSDPKNLCIVNVAGTPGLGSEYLELSITRLLLGESVPTSLFNHRFFESIVSSLASSVWHKIDLATLLEFLVLASGLTYEVHEPEDQNRTVLLIHDENWDTREKFKAVKLVSDNLGEARMYPVGGCNSIYSGPYGVALCRAYQDSLERIPGSKVVFSDDPTDFQPSIITVSLHKGDSDRQVHMYNVQWNRER